MHPERVEEVELILGEHQSPIVVRIVRTHIATAAKVRAQVRVLEVQLVKFEQFSSDGLIGAALYRACEVLSLDEGSARLLEQKIQRQQS